MPWENKRIEFYIPVFVALLMIIGLAVIYSATRDSGMNYLKRQIIWDILGIIVLFASVFLRERDIRRSVWMVYFAAIASLALVLVFGTTSGGARRWFDLKAGYFQPSELGKIAVVLVSATLLSKPTVKRVLVSLISMSAVLLLIAAEPDLGTAVLIAAVWFIILVCSKASMKLISIILIMIIAMIPFLYFFGLKDYQRDRILSFLSPSTYAQSSAYNVIQSLHAIGSGGLLGRGYLKGPATIWKYVPKNHTDFILSVLGEEFGFAGVLTCLFLYMALAFRILRTIMFAKDEFWQLINTGIMATFVLHVFENMGMAMGITPVTGIPLPFISYGGSSTLFFCIQLGLVMKSYAVGKAGKKLEGG